MTNPQPLPDADLPAWSVVLAYRGLQQKQGITILLLPFPPCPTCGGVVHGVESSTVERGIHRTATLTLRPCGHAHTATDDDIHRIHEHVGDMIDAMEQADRGQFPDGRAWTTEDVIRNARDCMGAPQEPLSAPRSVPEVPGGELAGQDGDSAPQAHADPHTDDALDELRRLLRGANYHRERAETALARVQHLADHIAAGAPWAANRDELARRIRDAATIRGGQTAAGATGGQENGGV